jgi:hypothetical protein
VKAQPREHGAGTDAEGRFSSAVFRPLSASVLAAFGAPVLRAVNCWPRVAPCGPNRVKRPRTSRKSPIFRRANSYIPRTRGSQVQILPLRPDFFDFEAFTEFFRRSAALVASGYLAGARRRQPSFKGSPLISLIILASVCQMNTYKLYYNHLQTNRSDA